MPIEPTADTLLTVAEAAAILGVSTRTVERLRKSGGIETVEVGSGPRPRVFYRQSEVLDHLAAREDVQQLPGAMA